MSSTKTSLGSRPDFFSWIVDVLMLRFCRMWDAFDFATVSLTVTEAAKDFGVENSEVTWVRCSHLRAMEIVRGKPPADSHR